MKSRWMIAFAAVLLCAVSLQAKESGTHYAEEVYKPLIDSGECPGAIPS